GNVSTILLDELGRIGEVLEHVPDFNPPHAVATNYVYGPFDTVTQIGINQVISSPIGPIVTPLRTTTMTYDDLGRRKRLEDHDAGVSVRTYNAFGEIVRETMGGVSDLETVIYVRDQIGRVTLEASSLDGTNTFEWDTRPFGLGRPARSSSFDGVS